MPEGNNPKAYDGGRVPLVLAHKATQPFACYHHHVKYSQDEMLRKRPRKQIWVRFCKSGNFTLLSYFEYAESTNVSCQIFIWQESPNFKF